MSSFTYRTHYVEEESKDFCVEDSILPSAIITKSGDVYDYSGRGFVLRAAWLSTRGHITGTPCTEPKEVEELGRVELEDAATYDGESQQFYFRLTLAGLPTEEEIKFHVKNEFTEQRCGCEHDCCGHWFGSGGVVDAVNRKATHTVVWVSYSLSLNV